MAQLALINSERKVILLQKVQTGFTQWTGTISLWDTKIHGARYFQEYIWNSYRIHKQAETTLPAGIPNHTHAFPEEYDMEECSKVLTYIFMQLFVLMVYYMLRVMIMAYVVMLISSTHRITRFVL